MELYHWSNFLPLAKNPLESEFVSSRFGSFRNEVIEYRVIPKVFDFPFDGRFYPVDFMKHKRIISPKLLDPIRGFSAFSVRHCR